MLNHPIGVVFLYAVIFTLALLILMLHAIR